MKSNVGKFVSITVASADAGVHIEYLNLAIPVLDSTSMWGIFGCGMGQEELLGCERCGGFRKVACIESAV